MPASFIPTTLKGETKLRRRKDERKINAGLKRQNQEPCRYNNVQKSHQRNIYSVRKRKNLKILNDSGFQPS
jgi:hypothetical protein